MQDDQAIWATVTMTEPQVVQWQIEGGEDDSAGTDLAELLTVLAEQKEGRPKVLRLNLMFQI